VQVLDPQTMFQVVSMEEEARVKEVPEMVAPPVRETLPPATVAQSKPVAEVDEALKYVPAVPVARPATALPEVQ
jgi:hypothetical protein